VVNSSGAFWFSHVNARFNTLAGIAYDLLEKFLTDTGEAAS